MANSSNAAVFTNIYKSKDQRTWYETNGWGTHSSLSPVSDAEIVLTSRDASHIGDHIVPLSWFNGEITLRGKRECEEWMAHKVVYDEITPYPRGRYEPYRTLFTKSVQPYSLAWLQANPFSRTVVKNNLEVTNPRLGESLILHGDYHLSDKKALIELKNVKVDLGVLIAEASETVMYFADYAVAGAKLLHSIRTGRWDKALLQLGVSKRRFRRINKRVEKRYPISTKHGSSYVNTSVLGKSRDVYEWGAERRSSKEYAVAMMNQAAARHLELQFAIKPLVYTMNDLQGLTNASLQELQNARIVGKGRHSLKLHGETVDGKARQSGSVNTVTKLVAKSTNLSTAINKGFGLDTFIVPAWEIVPWSSLLDYVVDIGDFLKAATATKDLAFEYGYQSTKLESTIIATNRTDTRSNPVQVMQKYALYTMEKEYRCYVRRTLNQFPFPRISYVLDEISYPHLKNVAALATVMLLGKRKDSTSRL